MLIVYITTTVINFCLFCFNLAIDNFSWAAFNAITMLLCVYGADRERGKRDSR